MVQAIRRHINATSLVALLALVIAMTGGAYAASKYVITSTKQINPKVLKSLKGTAGKPGSNGAQGPAGPVGPQGPAGAAGIEGKAGREGNVGAKGVTGAAGATGPKGATGATGANGTTGAEGVCTKANCTLPSGATETGTWTAFYYGLTEGELPIKVALSFPIPLPSSSSKAFVFTEEQTAKKEFGASGCAGSSLHPTAPAETLCVYTSNERLENVEGPTIEELEGGQGYAPTGTSLRFETTSKASPAEPAHIREEGTWAVTSP